MKNKYKFFRVWIFAVVLCPLLVFSNAATLLAMTF